MGQLVNDKRVNLRKRKRTRQPPPLGLLQVSVQLSPFERPPEQADVMPSEAPTVLHWRSRLVQRPLAQ